MNTKPLVTELYCFADFTNQQRLAQWARRYAAYKFGTQKRFPLLIVAATRL